MQTHGIAKSGWFYPGIAMIVSCGALTGMHVFWIGTYTCKRFPEERWVRIIGYGGEVLESVGIRLFLQCSCYQ